MFRPVAVLFLVALLWMGWLVANASAPQPRRVGAAVAGAEPRAPMLLVGGGVVWLVGRRRLARG